MSEPAIRRASPGDAETLAGIGARTFAETFGHLYPPQDLQGFLEEAYDAPRIRADLADPAKAAWLVDADGQAVGYAQVGPCTLPHPEVTERCGELKRFYFLKSWQSRGLGSRLFGEAIDWLQQAGPRDIWIGVWSENFGAQRFYARQGFEKVGEYDFHVGATVDREFILRRRAESFAGSAKKPAKFEHNPA